ncbi:hypothetical protein FPOAC1_003542 [Fusarium poae]|uniref:hypothetical protein n=1 Tax=Fusarium poae TaxID=36050 RepID=UPI001CE7FD4C|nr:hypothetical protein FPOAC1_003542 [Fusarium poae]KAG8677519.1 hypothetical protein FPOAC1_003542 [Fusarium poae]
MSRHDKFPALLLGEKAVRERCVLSSEVKASEMDASVALPPPIRCLSHMHSALLNMPIKSWQGNLFVGVRQPPHLSSKDSSEKSRRPPPTWSEFAVRVDWDMKPNHWMTDQEGFWKTSMPVMHS